MRTQKELLIATKPFAQEQRWLSWWHVGSTLTVLGLLLALACADLPWVMRLPISVLAGLVIVRMFVLYHDHQHDAILRGSRAATVLMRVFGLLILSPSSGWKRSHDHHHAHNSKMSGPNIGSYPLMTTDEYRRTSRGGKWRYVIERHPLTMIFGYLTVFFTGMCVLPLLSNPRRHFDGAVSIVCHLGLLTWLARGDLDDFWLAGIIPCSIASAVGSYLFYAQHNFPGARIHVGADWKHVDAALDSSSYIEMGPVLRWLTANIGYHHVHHLNSRIPFYRLPETMAALAELQHPTTISLHPRDMLACLRLNLWDADAGQLVPWSALRRPAPAEPAAIPVEAVRKLAA